jgi:hypothetical protein
LADFWGITNQANDVSESPDLKRKSVPPAITAAAQMTILSALIVLNENLIDGRLVGGTAARASKAARGARFA